MENHRFTLNLMHLPFHLLTFLYLYLASVFDTYFSWNVLFMTGQSIELRNFKTVLLSPWSIPLLIYIYSHSRFFHGFDTHLHDLRNAIRGIHFFSWRSSSQIPLVNSNVLNGRYCVLAILFNSYRLSTSVS